MDDLQFVAVLNCCRFPLGAGDNFWLSSTATRSPFRLRASIKVARVETFSKERDSPLMVRVMMVRRCEVRETYFSWDILVNLGCCGKDHKAQSLREPSLGLRRNFFMADLPSWVACTRTVAFVTVSRRRGSSTSPQPSSSVWDWTKTG